MNMKSPKQKTDKPLATHLSREAKILLAVGGLFTISTSLSGTFVNVYLWRAKNDFVMIGIFNLFQYLFIPIAFYIGGWLTKKAAANLSLRLGLLLHMAFFLTILLVNQRAIAFVIPLGILMGLAAGFYWVAFQILTFDMTSRMNRDTYNSTLGMIFSISNMLSPLASGYIISMFPTFKGYRLVFIASAVLYVIIWLISLMLKAQPYNQPIDLKACWKEAGEPLRYILYSHVFMGIKNGVFMFLITLLVFIMTKKELSIGKLALVSSLVSFITFFGLEKILKPQRRVLFFTLGSVMMLVSVLFIVVKVSIFTLFAFGIMNAVFAPFFQVPFDSATLNIIDKSSATRSRTEYIILKEISLNIGRLAGVFAFLLLLARNYTPVALRIFLLVTGSAPLILILFRKRLDFDTRVVDEDELNKYPSTRS